MKQPFSTLLWRYLLMPLCIIAICGAVVIGFYGKANPPVTAAIWAMLSILVGTILLRGEKLPDQHRAKEMQRRAEALKRVREPTDNTTDA